MRRGVGGHLDVEADPGSQLQRHDHGFCSPLVVLVTPAFF